MPVARFVSSNVKPVHQHDCDKCRFLGRLDNNDLYVCEERTLPGKVCFIRRHGSEGEEYGTLGDLTPEGTPYNLARILFERDGQPNQYRTR